MIKYCLLDVLSQNTTLKKMLIVVREAYLIMGNMLLLLLIT